jgi:uncharacterized protein DUF6677
MTEPRPIAGRAENDVSFGRTAAALLAGWLVPGAGHAVLGRMRRAALFFALIMGSFGLGLAHDGRLALYSPREGFLTGLQLVANVGVGPADVFARMGVYGEAAYAVPDTSAASYRPRIEKFRERQRSAVSAYGTAYLWSAGLMNLLLLMDVWDIAKRRKD